MILKKNIGIFIKSENLMKYLNIIFIRNLFESNVIYNNFKNKEIFILFLWERKRIGFHYVSCCYKIIQTFPKHKVIQNKNVDKKQNL